MLTREENELLTRTGPGTPMGEVLRHYWVPALLSEELPDPDCPPVRVRLLGEDLVAFRDSSGAAGLLDRYCPHRGASLFFGRNEESGLRCVYHGWKFDAVGACVDMPNEPVESDFKGRIRLKWYGCRERGGVIWAYMGSTTPTPALAELEWAVVPEAQRCVSKRLQECNYLQALEGGVDLSHIAFLHRNLDPGRDARDQTLTRGDTRPAFEVVDTDYGLLIAARRNAEADRFYWRISQWIMPWYTMFPPLVDTGIGGHAFIPIDDESCWVYNMTWDPGGPLGAVGDGIYGDLLPGTYRSSANRGNDFLLDRVAQRSVSFTGIPGFAAQDCAVQESMGLIAARDRERLGTTDVPVAALRRRLLQAVETDGHTEELPGLAPESQRVRPAALLLPRDVPFQKGAGDVLRSQSRTYALRV